MDTRIFVDSPSILRLCRQELFVARPNWGSFPTTMENLTRYTFEKISRLTRQELFVARPNWGSFPTTMENLTRYTFEKISRLNKVSFIINLRKISHIFRKYVIGHWIRVTIDETHTSHPNPPNLDMKKHIIAHPLALYLQINKCC
jgi:hypothetical protein